MIGGFRHYPNLKVSHLGGPSFSSAIQVAFNPGLQPLKLQGLKPLTKRCFSSGLKSRPPRQSSRCNTYQIRAAASFKSNCRILLRGSKPNRKR